MRFLTSGESHGPVLTAIVEGLPSSLPVSAGYIDRQLERRQRGYGRGGRMSIERDRVRFLAGVRGGLTLGGPVTLQIENRDWVNWSEIMSAEEGARTDERVVTRPRPGHADLPGAIKYRHRDIRNVLERSSARETAARVAVGSLARRLLEELGIEIIGLVLRIGAVESTVPALPLEELRSAVENSRVFCPDREAEEAMIREIDRAAEEGDTLGGVFEIRVFGLPVGLGSYVHWDRRLDGRVARALMSVQAIKGVEFGLGFSASALRGSQVHDEIFYSPGRGFYRKTNNAGGVEGGVSNGEPLVVRAAMKPIPTLRRPLKTVDLISKEPVEAAFERSDVCAVPAACVVGEAVVAWELGVAVMEKFGGDSLAEVKDNYARYLEWVRQV